MVLTTCWNTVRHASGVSRGVSCWEDDWYDEYFQVTDCVGELFAEGRSFARRVASLIALMEVL